VVDINEFSDALQRALMFCQAGQIIEFPAAELKYSYYDDDGNQVDASFEYENADPPKDPRQ